MNVSVVEAQSPFDEGVTFLAKLSKPVCLESIRRKIKSNKSIVLEVRTERSLIITVKQTGKDLEIII